MNTQIDLIKQKQQLEGFMKSFKEHILELQLPTEEELRATMEGDGILARRMQDMIQNREYHYTEQSDNNFQNFDQRERYKKRNYLNLFQVERGPCRLCATKEESKCTQYRACFNIETFRGIELFSCLNCGCPMNSHQTIQQEYNFSNNICQQINRRYVSEEHISFKACVSIYFVDQVTAAEFKIDIEGFIACLNEAGFNALSFYEIDISALQKIWLRKSLYSKKSNIKPDEFQHYEHFLEIFFEIASKYDSNNSLQVTNLLQEPRDINIFEFYQERLQKVNKKLGLPYQCKKVAFVFLISGDQQQLQIDYKKFIYAAKSQISYLHTDYKKYLIDELKFAEFSQSIPEKKKTTNDDMFYTSQQQEKFKDFQSKQQQKTLDLIYFYSSKTKNKAIRDCLLFFPQFFKLNVVSFLLTQQEDEVHTDKRKMNDVFQDMLDFNNIYVFKQEFNQAQCRNLNDAFKFIKDTERFLKSFSFDSFGPNIKIGYKIGTQQLNIMSQNLPNYYKISLPTHNQTLCDRLCPEIFHNQRILIIYRPIVVKSDLQGLLTNIWKLNDFMEIDSQYIRLTLQEARMLASIERIHPQNLNNYLTMMTEGFSLVILFTRPGAYQGAKVIASGCSSGLKVRQSKKLQELQIQHQAKTGQFVEKLPMNFNNFFEQFTKQNVFMSIKDLINLEELVLQENKSKINKNIFLNEDDHVFLVPNQTDLNGISIQLKQQLVKDLPKENYNYFVFVSSDEISTEQLTSLFIPSCSQIEHVFVIVKPVIQNNKDNIEEIKQLLGRMKFYLFDYKKFTLNEEEIKTLIQNISPYNLSENELNNYITQYKNSPIYILSLMKQAGMKEMTTFLTGYNFQFPQFVKPQLIQEIKPFLIPCLNYKIIQFVAGLFNQGFYKFDAQTFEQPNMNDIQTYLLRYMLCITVGIEMDNVYEKLEQESTEYHVHVRVSSKQHGDFEIRVRSSHDYGQSLEFYQLDQVYELQSWYYSKINSFFPQRAPVVYQYRIFFPERIKFREIDQVFDCQEYPGRNFLLEIYRQVFDFGHNVYEALKQEKLKHLDQKYKTSNEVVKKEVKVYEEQMLRVNLYMNKRSKMIAYFWGVKLAKFTKELELIPSEEDFPNGFGEINKREKSLIYECKHKINTLAHDHISYVYKKHYKEIFEKLNAYIQEKIESDGTYYDDLNKMQQSNFEFGQSQLFSQQQDMRKDQTKTNAERRLTRYFNAILPNDQCCELLKANMNEFKILPKDLQLSQIRIQNERDQIKTKKLEGQNTFYDWNHEAEEQKRSTIRKNEKMKDENENQPQEQQRKNDKDSYITPYCNFVLSHCLPIVRPQYELAATILYLLQVELKQFKFYDKFIDISILEEDWIFKQNIDKKSTFSSKSDKLRLQFDQMSKLNYYTWFKENFQMDKKETIDQIIKGFKDSYFINEEMVQTMQQIYKEQQYNKKNRMPDLLGMFLFLKCMDELNKYIDLHKSVKDHMAQLSKQSLNMEQYFKQTEQRFETQKQDPRMRHQEILELKGQQEKYEFYIKTILLYVASDEFQKEFYFDSEQTELKFNQIKLKVLKFNSEYFSQFMQNNLTSFDNEEREQIIQEELRKYFEFKKDNHQQKEFIESKRYFQPLEQGNNKNEWGKLDQETIDEKLQELEKKRRDEVINKLNQDDAEIPYLRDFVKDEIQQRWVEGIAAQKGRFVDTRPDNQKTGIYVDTVKTVEKRLDEKIDTVIKRFMQDKMNNFNKK